MLFLSFALMEATNTIPEPKKVDFLCDTCTILVSGAEEYISDPSNIGAVEEFLQQACSILPFDLFGWCEQIISKYYEELIKYITEGYPPEVACQKIGLC